jgi:outer membrane receptor protein involved in Fe transport
MRDARRIALAVLFAAAPMLAKAQDTTRTRADTGVRTAPRLRQVTITTTPVERSEPLTVVHLTPLTVSLTPSNSTWELFRQAAGLEVHEQGQGPGFASDLSIRGFSSDHSTDMALYIDGVPNNEPANGHSEGYNDINLLFPQIITGVDVIKGPTSALYGNFAFGGAVNVRTLNRFPGLDMAVGGGSFGLGNGYLIAGFDRGSTGGVLAVQGLHEDGWRTHAANQYGHVHAAIVHDLSQSTTIDASADGYLTSYDSPGFLDTTLYNAGRNNFVSNFGDGGFKRHAQERVSVRTFLTPSLEWRTTGYAQQGSWQFWLSSPPGLGGLTEGTGAETHESDSRYGFGGTTALTLAAQGVDVTLGVDGRYTHAQYRNFAESSTGYRVDSVPLVLALPATQSSGGLFLQAGLDVTRFARVELGARLDQLSTWVRQPQTDTSGNLLVNSLYEAQHAKGIFSPKAGLLIRPFAGVGASGVGLFVNVSRGFRQTDGVISDPTLPFITVWDYETGVKLDYHSWTVDASLFRMEVSNEQTFDPALNTVVGGGQSRRNGLDVGASGHLAAGVTANADFTILDGFYTHFLDANDNNNDYSHQPIFNTSKYVGSLRLDFDIPAQRWVAQVGTNFQGPYTPFEELGIVRPGYALLNLSGGMRLGGRSELILGVRNALDVRYRELESGGQTVPGQGRTVYALMRYRTTRPTVPAEQP